MPAALITIKPRRIEVRTLFLGGNNRFNTHGYGITLVQPLFRQQSWMAYTESELQVAQSEAQFKVAEQDLVLRVAQAYFDVLIAQDSVQLAEAQKSAITEQLEQAKRNFEVGSATITDIYEAQARFDLTSAQHIVAQNNLEIKRRQLQQLLNAQPQELNSLGKGFKLESPQPAEMEKGGRCTASNPQHGIGGGECGAGRKRGCPQHGRTSSYR